MFIYLKERIRTVTFVNFYYPQSEKDYQYFYEEKEIGQIGQIPRLGHKL